MLQIHSLRINTSFKFVKNIRKYTYSIEKYLRDVGLCQSIQPLPTLSDESDPFLPRLSTFAPLEGKTISVELNQVSLSVAFNFTESVSFESVYPDSFNELIQITDSLKEFLNQLPGLEFTILFEGCVIIAARYIVKGDSILMDEYSLSTDTNEKRKREAIEIDDGYILLQEESLLKTYTQNEDSEVYPKYADERLIGWQFIYVVELNNRPKYNSTVGNVVAKFDFNYAKEKIQETFMKRLTGIK